MSNHGKKYLDAAKKIQADKLYTPEESLTLLKEISYVKFDETVELHFRLGIDPRHSDQQVRSTVVLPHGLGKTVRVLVFAESDVARAAEAAGADIIGDDEVIARIEKDGWTEFDVALATPDMMKKVSRLGKTLGRKGLMPNPKAGTVVPAEDIARAIQEARAGRIEFRNDKTGNIHSPIGKMSFTVEQLLGNFTTLVEAVIRNKPSAAKGTYVKRLVVSSTMAPGIKIDPSITHTLV